MKSELEKSKASGIDKLIFDMGKISKINLTFIKLIISVIENCQRTNVGLRVLGPSKLNDELKGFQETAELPIYQTVEEAKAAF